MASLEEPPRDLTPPPKKGGFRGNRKKRSGLCVSRRSDWKERGGTQVSQKRRSAKKRSRVEKDEVEKKLQRELRDSKKKLKTAEFRLQAERTRRVQCEQRATEVEQKLASKTEHCQRHCVTIETLPMKDFSDLKQQRAKAHWVDQFAAGVKELGDKLKMGPKVEEWTETYWKEFFQPPAGHPRDSESEGREPEPEAAADPHAEWRKKWARLFRLRGVADAEGAASSGVLRRLFIAAEITHLTGGKLDQLKEAMNRTITKRIRSHELKTKNGDHAGMWLEPADVIREMLMAAGAGPGIKYKINVMGDGRCFGNSRNTTFLALRIVLLEGHSSTSSEAVYCDHPGFTYETSFINHVEKRHEACNVPHAVRHAVAVRDKAQAHAGYHRLASPPLRQHRHGERRRWHGTSRRS